MVPRTYSKFNDRLHYKLYQFEDHEGIPQRVIKPLWSIDLSLNKGKTLLFLDPELCHLTQECAFINFFSQEIHNLIKFKSTYRYFLKSLNQALFAFFFSI